MNHCCSCNQDFGSIAAFDAHRVGTHEYTSTEGLRMDPPREDGRRCLYLHELHSSSRFAKNVRGAWSLVSQLESGRGQRLRPAA